MTQALEWHVYEKGKHVARFLSDVWLCRNDWSIVLIRESTGSIPVLLCRVVVALCCSSSFICTHYYLDINIAGYLCTNRFRVLILV